MDGMKRRVEMFTRAAEKLNQAHCNQPCDTPPKLSAIDARLTDLFRLTEVLNQNNAFVSDATEAIERRIAAVLISPPLSEAGCAADEKGQPTGPCPLAHSLDDLIERLSYVANAQMAIEARLNGIRDRVQL